MSTDPVMLDRRLAPIDWSALPPGATADRVSVPSGSLARITMGPIDGPRVVLVPGATGSKEDFQHVMPLFAAQGYRVESFDLAGQYQSADAGPENLRPPEKHYRMGLFVDDLLAVLKGGHTPVHLLGYSFAGAVAAAVAAERREMVSTLTMLSTPPTPGRTLRTMRIVGPLAGHASPRVSAAVLVQGIRWNLGGGSPALRRFVRSRLRRTRLESVRDIMAIMADLPDIRPGLRESGIPVLVAVGSRDLWPLRRHREFATACGARLAVYRAGHGPCETAPHQLVADMLRLFAEVESTG